MRYLARNSDVKTIDVKEVKKDTEIDTQFGKVLVTKGNYIATYTDKERKGQKFGITKADLDLLYKPVK